MKVHSHNTRAGEQEQHTIQDYVAGIAGLRDDCVPIGVGRGGDIYRISRLCGFRWFHRFCFTCGRNFLRYLVAADGADLFTTPASVAVLLSLRPIRRKCVQPLV